MLRVCRQGGEAEEQRVCIYIYKQASRLKILRKSIHIPRKEILIKSKQKLSEILIKSRQKVSETVCILNYERSNKFI
jgi:hypothetical protein